MVTSFVFRVKNVPAALYKAMGGFATNGVNMTKLESYQLGGSFNATQFYADIQGHPEDPPVKRALEELAFYTTTGSPFWALIRPIPSAKTCPSAGTFALRVRRVVAHGQPYSPTSLLAPAADRKITLALFGIGVDLIPCASLNPDAIRIRRHDQPQHAMPANVWRPARHQITPPIPAASAHSGNCGGNAASTSLRSTQRGQRRAGR